MFTTGRKANISTRSVRRVIARLEAEGHVLVHRGGGRAGSANSYTVMTGDPVVRSPRRSQRLPADAHDTDQTPSIAVSTPASRTPWRALAGRPCLPLDRRLRSIFHGRLNGRRRRLPGTVSAGGCERADAAERIAQPVLLHLQVIAGLQVAPEPL